jgi:hypothetical protein
MDNLIWDLDFYVNYYRKKQMERLNAHLEEKRSLSSFLYSENEQDLDSLIAAAQRVLDALEAENDKKNAKKKRFWKR